MRVTPLLWLVLPLLGTGLVSIETRPEAVIEGPLLIANTRSPKELLENDEVPNTSRRAVESPTLSADEKEAPPLLEIEAFTAAELPLLPINLMFDEDPSYEGYADWYRGTSWQHLCQSVFRIDLIMIWDPETCACVNPELELRSSERLRHARVHALNERKDLLGIERGWLLKEMVREMRADLTSGGSLLTSTPNTKEQMRRALERASEEERFHLELLLAMARQETKQVAIEAELKAGRFKVKDQFLCSFRPPRGAGRIATDPETGKEVWHLVTLDRGRHQQYFQYCDQQEWLYGEPVQEWTQPCSRPGIPCSHPGSVRRFRGR